MHHQGLTLFAYLLRLCAAGARLGGSSPSASNHFWAPTPTGPTGGASAERVTLEVLNRRIRTNADMLLDFKVGAWASKVLMGRWLHVLRWLCHP